MDQDEEEYLKRAIEMAYTQYIGADGKATIADVAKFFNIPIDKLRLTDYEIESINYNDELSIKLVDKKNHTEFKAKYTYGYRVHKLRYIRVVATNTFKRLENIYYFGDANPIITKMEFTDGEYKLIFERERPNDAGIHYIRPNTQFTIKYVVINYKDEGEICLLSKTFQKHDDGQLTYDFEQTGTNQHVANYENLCSENRHYYIENDNIMYGVEFFQSALQNNVQGGLFESTKVSHIGEHFPSSMQYHQTSSRLKDKDTLSAIILVWNVGLGNHYELEVYKTNQGMVGNYKVRIFPNEELDEELGKSMYLNNTEFQLQNMDEGMITSREVNYLLGDLRSRFKDASIELISDDLLQFARKIDVRKGIAEEDPDPLSPKLFFDKSFKEIESIIESDKDRYFNLAAEQYSRISHQDRGKGQVKVLKPNNNSQSSEN